MQANAQEAAITKNHITHNSMLVNEEGQVFVFYAG